MNTALDTDHLTFYSATQIAKMLGVSRRAVSYWITSGALPAVNISQGSQRTFYRISVASLREFTAARAVKTRRARSR